MGPSIAGSVLGGPLTGRLLLLPKRCRVSHGVRGAPGGSLPEDVRSQQPGLLLRNLPKVTKTWIIPSSY